METATYSSGKAGSIIVNVADSITLAGSDRTFFQRLATFNDETIVGATEKSGLYSSTSQKATGQGGDLRITTGRLLVSGEALVSVSSQGTGEAGNLIVTADSIRLNNGSLKAESRNGSLGNITLNADNLQLREQSTITTNATALATGGNINLNVDALVQLDSSDITANAVQGKGGNININTQGIFRSPDSDISASSQLGINGIVNITTPDIKQDSSLQKQASNFINAETVVANSCLASRNSQSGKFVVTGNGGIAQTPDSTDIPYEVTQVQPLLIGKIINLQQNSFNRAWKLGSTVTEAKELHFTPDGRIVLTTTIDNDNILNAQNLTCR